MKNKKNKFVILSVFVFLLGSVFWTAVGYMQINSGETDLSLKGYTNKEAFILGEPVAVRFEFSNNGNTPLAVHQLGVENGILKIFVAREGNEFKRYWGYGWGQKMGRMRSLAPGESHSYKEAKILYQGKISTDGLSKKAIQEKLDGNVTTEYAFPEPGVYFIKAVSSYADKIPSFGKDSAVKIKSIESEPIKVVIKEPAGEDLEIWNQIKGNGEIALLMQDNVFNTSKPMEKEALTDKVEQIIERHPNSIYSGYFRLNLEKFKAVEAKRNELFKYSRNGQQPE
jgi:hypothetical protein